LNSISFAVQITALVFIIKENYLIHSVALNIGEWEKINDESFLQQQNPL